MAARLALFAALTALFSATAPESGRASLFFLFEPTSARPGQTVTVRLGGTPKSFTQAQAVRPFRRGIRLYLAPNGTVERARTRFDTSLHYVATVVPDANGRGKLSFTVPPLDAGAYAIAAWCPGCARSSFGRTFFTLPVSSYTAARYPMLLKVQPLPVSPTCPVTVPNGSRPAGERPAQHFHGNGLLWTGFAPDRALGLRQEDGSYFDKLLWTTILYETLTFHAVRLDATSPPARWKANEGGSAGSWATAVWFPSAGCWRLTTRVGDASLSVVVRVGDP